MILNRLVLCSLAILACQGIALATEWDEILPAGNSVSKLAEGFKFTEGPAWHPDGFLLFTDIPNDRIMKWDGTQISEFATPVGRCNGLMADQRGTIYACQMGDGHVITFNSEGRQTGALVDTFDGNRLNGPNDLTIDQQGGMYFTDPYYGPDKELPQPMMAVYYVDPEGNTTRIIEDLDRPNGVTVSPNGRYLYVAEPNKAELYRYHIQKPGIVSAGTLIFKGDPEVDGTSGPDGMTHDIHGNIYTTYNGIVVLNPNGDVLGRIPVPEKPANCTFGGKDRQDLFITARTGLYHVQTGVPGIELPQAGPKLPEKVSFLTNWLTWPVLAETKAGETQDVKLGTITLTVPTSWEQKPPENRLRLAQFIIPAAEGVDAATELVVFPPFGGSVDDNITRWVNQFQAEGRKLTVTQGTSAQGAYYLADMSGTYMKPDGPPFLRKTIDVADHRMLAVILTVEGQGNYFLKLVGPTKTVDAAAEAFRASFGAKKDEEKPYELAQ